MSGRGQDKRELLSLIAVGDGLEPLTTETLRQFGVPTHTDSFRWLGPGEACAWEMADFSDAAFDGLASELADRSIDLNRLPCPPGAGPQVRLLVADMDSTIIEQECIDELAVYAGKAEEIAAITKRAMAGELDFEDALTARVAMLAGLPEAILDEVYRERISFTPGAVTLMKTFAKHGIKTALVSGGFTPFTNRVRAGLGMDADFANRLVIERGKLTGAVERPVLGRKAKAETLERLRTDYGLPAMATMAVGDGANDLAMIREAGLGVAFRAKPIVTEAAPLALSHSDLTGLLYLAGIPADQHVR